MLSRSLGSTLGFTCLLIFASFAADAAPADSGEPQRQPEALDDAGNWFAFEPKSDPFTNSPIDLRVLNEKFAGEHGLISVRDGHFIHSGNGQPVRFWAVNGPPQE